MISLRKHMDEFTAPSGAKATAAEPGASDRGTNPRNDSRQKSEKLSAKPSAQPPLDPALSAYCTVLNAVGESGQRAVPGIGDELIRNFAQIQEALARMPNRETVEVTTARVQAELSRWADRAWQHHADNEREIKEIINVLATASETVAERDKKYAAQLGDLGGRMSAIAELDDLPLIRRSILESTRALKACVEKMSEDSRQSVKKLAGEVAECRSRLAESERAACTDDLTQVGNRRAFETELEHRIAARHTFSLIMLDLNGFKNVNDRYGHIAGDDLLRQFAGELRLQFGVIDLLARWGGDEFAGIIAGPQQEAEERIERIRRWVLGDYKISVNCEIVKIKVEAAIGVAAWSGRETGVELLARVDRCLYEDKARFKTT
jgi:diguanylate cyclase